MLKSIRAENEAQIESVKKTLMQLPQGRLIQDASKNSIYYKHLLFENGKRVRKGINKKPELIQALIRQRVLNAQLNNLLEEQKALEYVIEHLKDFDIKDELRTISNEFPALSKDFILNSLAVSESSDWANAEYEHFNYKPEEKKQITSRGLRVRSKSEVLIAEKLYSYSLAERYEQVMHIGSIDIGPDFTIRRSDGKIFIWEHEGLTNNKRYVDWQIKKLQLYASIGFYPWDNLIITYDNVDGIIDLREIDFIIQTKLLI